MKELKPYLQRNLITSGPLNLFLMNKRRKHGQEHKPATISNYNTELSRMKRSVKLLSRETTRIDFKFQTASSLSVYIFEWFSQQATLTFLHPHFAMSKLKDSMQDRQKPFSESQQATAVETFDNFRYKSFLKSCLYSAWFMFIEFVFKLVSGSLFFFSRSRHQKHPEEALWIQVTGSAF